MTIKELYETYKYDGMTICFMCHSCKYVRWHPLVFCKNCPNKLQRMELKWDELVEKYSDYKDSGV